MVTSTTAGNTAYKIYLSDAKTGAAGSETPDGNVVYFFAEDYDDDFTNLQSPKPTLGKSFYVPASKYAINISLKNVQIVAQGANTATTEYNTIKNFLFQNSVKAGSSGMYLFIYHESNSQYIKLDWNTSYTATQSIPVAFNTWSGHATKGKMHTLSTIKFIKSG